MKLTDADRLILANQYQILAIIDPDDENKTEAEFRENLLRRGFQRDPRLIEFDTLGKTVPADRLKLVAVAYKMCELLKMPFVRFQDEQLNEYAELCNYTFAEGTPLSDDEYYALIERPEARDALFRFVAAEDFDPSWAVVRKPGKVLKLVSVSDDQQV